MRAAYDAAAVRAAEAPLLASLPEGTLMKRASFALARRCAALLGGVYGARVVVLAGSGGNGGDALYAGARLAARGGAVEALLLSDSVLVPALQALEAAGGRSRLAGADSDATLLASADLVIDGMVGIGASGRLRDPMARVVSLLGAGTGGPVVVSVDVPSGVDASTGEVSGPAVRADVTVTFGALKIGLVVDPGADHTGRLEVVDIGLSPANAMTSLLDASDVGALLPRPQGESDKYRRGVVGVVAGSAAYTGAAQLCVGGALAAGAGMVRYIGVAAPAEMVRRRWPEAVVTQIVGGDVDATLAAGRVQAWVIGPGLGTDDAAGRIVAGVLGTDLPVLLDADAITWLASHRDVVTSRAAATLITPHAGEFGRLMSLDREDVEAHRLTHARHAAAELGVTVLLKGATTLIASPTGEVRVNSASTPYLATAGSGDVLSGVCGALLSGGLSALDAGSAGAFLHGMAALIASGSPSASVTAMDIAAALPEATRVVHS